MMNVNIYNQKKRLRGESQRRRLIYIKMSRVLLFGL